MDEHAIINSMMGLPAGAARNLNRHKGQGTDRVIVGASRAPQADNVGNPDECRYPRALLSGFSSERLSGRIFAASGGTSHKASN